MLRTRVRVSAVLTVVLVVVLAGWLTGCRRQSPSGGAAYVTLTQAFVDLVDPPPTGDAAVPLKEVIQPRTPLEEFVLHRIIFESPVFYGTRFSSFDFDNVTKVKSLIGPYTLSATFYNGQGDKVETADKPGRYGAVVEIKHGEGRPSRRFVTLCRLAGDARPEGHTRSMDPEVLKAGGVDESVLADYGNDKDRPRFRPNTTSLMVEMINASTIAGLVDRTRLKAEGKPLRKDSVMQMDRQWWVEFKRRFYGLDKVYPNPFVCPRPIEGEPALVVHEGTLAEAGMRPDARETIDAACENFVKQEQVGFSLCVVRHGVIVINKGYGKQAGNGMDKGAHKDDPYLADTPGPMASGAKFFGGILFVEFMDQGLVDPDLPVDKYVPALRDIQVKKPMTLRDCYIHIAGFNTGVGDFNSDLEELVADLYPVMEVGVRHNYHGGGLALGGKVEEMISGDCFPRLIREHLLDPLGCAGIDTPGTGGGGLAVALDLAKVGQMVVNGGAYGNMRFFHAQALAKAMPVPGHSRWNPPDPTCRWGIGIKQFDSDQLSTLAVGHPGASGTCLVVDPKYDLVIAMTRYDEGGKFKLFLKEKGAVYKVILDAIQN